MYVLIHVCLGIFLPSRIFMIGPETFEYPRLEIDLSNPYTEETNFATFQRDKLCKYTNFCKKLMQMYDPQWFFCLFHVFLWKLKPQFAFWHSTSQIFEIYNGLGWKLYEEWFLFLFLFVLSFLLFWVFLFVFFFQVHLPFYKQPV